MCCYFCLSITMWVATLARRPVPSPSQLKSSALSSVLVLMTDLLQYLSWSVWEGVLSSQFNAFKYDWFDLGCLAEVIKDKENLMSSFSFYHPYTLSWGGGWILYCMAGGGREHIGIVITHWNVWICLPSSYPSMRRAKMNILHFDDLKCKRIHL